MSRPLRILRALRWIISLRCTWGLSCNISVAFRQRKSLLLDILLVSCLFVWLGNWLTLYFLVIFSGNLLEKVPLTSCSSVNSSYPSPPFHTMCSLFHLSKTHPRILGRLQTKLSQEDQAPARYLFESSFHIKTLSVAVCELYKCYELYTWKGTYTRRESRPGCIFNLLIKHSFDH